MTEDGRRATVPRASSLALCALLAAPLATAAGDGSIRAAVGTSELVIATSARMAGAIDSLTWGGVPFIDAADHGRELQSASSFDLARPGPFWAECYNPTEAGSRHDGAGAASTSRLLEYKADGAELRTRTQMAFWLKPGELSEGRPALNTNTLSSHVLGKRVRIGCPGLPQVLDYRVEFVVPAGERHHLAQFEALTGYMPETFSRFLACDPATGALHPLSDGPGEQQHPVILSTPDGAHAMGIHALPSPGAAGPTYGRWRFDGAHVTKWNCVFRVRDTNGIAPGVYAFQMYVPIGSLEDVRSALVELHRRAP